MTYEQVFEGFKSLNAADRMRFLEAGRRLNKFENENLRIGAKVQFKTRYGAYVHGKLVRYKRKNVEVHSFLDRHGRHLDQVVRWNVPLEMLIPLTVDQAKNLEFP